MVPKAKGKGRRQSTPSPYKGRKDTPATAASFSSGLPSSSSTSSISGITLPSVKGLQNLGNTCFANSVLQSLSQALPFVEAFDTLRKEGYVLETSVPLLSGTPNGSGEPTTGTEMPKKPLKLTLPEPGPFSEAFGSLLKQMSNTATKQAVVTPSHFVSLFQQEHSAGSGRWFQAGHQHDAHELLRFLLARISEEENNRITASLLTSSQLSFSCKSADDFKPDQLSEEQLKEWESVKDICQSSSVEYFFGAQILTRALCEECGRLHFSISLQMDIPLYLNAEDGEEPCSQGKPKGSPAGQTKGKEWKSKRERREAAKLNKKLQKKKRKEGEKSVSMEELAAANNRHNASPTEQEGDPTEKEEDEETTVEEEETVHNETEGDSGSPPPASDGDVSLATSVEEGKEEEGEEFPVEVVTKEERDSGCGSGESLQEEEDGRSRKEESEDRSVTDQKAFCDETLAERLAELKLSHEDSGGESSVQDDDDDNEDARSEVEEEEDGIIAKLVSVFEPKVLFTPTTSGMMDLPTLISRFLGEDKIGLECRGCGYERNKGKKVLIRSPHVRSHLILRPPPLLTLHVQRATFGLLHWRRNTRKTTRRDATPVQVTSILDLTPFCVSSNTSWIYDLFAVIAHEGGQANSGHYVAYVKQRALGSTPTASLTQVIGATKSLKSRKLSRALELLDLNKADPVSSSGGSQAKSLGPSQWYRASDSSVKAVKEEEVLKTGNRGEAYLLFYELKMAAK
ncbi:unnamed protein product [Cyprideis torosa]|uniref:Ubiquitin carboxyl-terminal hydrolase n=1 Tax=Cyprideis torosa TaxID=163714 RepID=A0A7R8W3W8_9CRUS|nr:unnamed protein product [Cyprideis torosa]CAG0882571.1 unnamed protein product [Cyprideis torosa]